MEVILLERVGKLGQMGDVVRVKDGYARNFLLPRGKALRANAESKAKYEGMKAELQKQSLERKGEAGKVAAKVDGKPAPNQYRKFRVKTVVGADDFAVILTDALGVPVPWNGAARF